VVRVVVVVVVVVVVHSEPQRDASRERTRIPQESGTEFKTQMGRSSARATAAAKNKASKPLSATELGRLFVHGGDIKTAAGIARDGEDDADEDDATAVKERDGDDTPDWIVSAEALRASYAASAKTVETRSGFDFKSGFEPTNATWSLLGGTRESAAATTAKENAGEGDGGVTRADEDAKKTGTKEASTEEALKARDARERRPKKRERPPRALRAPVSASEVMGLGNASGIDALASSWRAPEEKEMLEKWHEQRDGWRDDYKRKRRAALRNKKGGGSTVLA